MTNRPIKFGTKSYVITTARWNSETQMAEITFEDDKGIVFHTEAYGMETATQRCAVVDAICSSIRRAM